MFEDNADRTGNTGYFLPEEEIKDYNVKTEWQNFFDQPAKNEPRACDNIRKSTTGQGEDYATGCLLDYPYFESI